MRTQRANDQSQVIQPEQQYSTYEYKMSSLIGLFLFSQLFMINYLGFMIWQYKIIYLLLQFWIYDLIIIIGLLYMKRRHKKNQGWLVIDTLIGAVYKTFILTYFTEGQIQVQYASYILLSYYVIRKFKRQQGKWIIQICIYFLLFHQNYQKIKAIQGIKFLLILQMMLVTMKWTQTIIWNWYSIFSISWGLLVVTSIVHIVIIMSFCENLLDYLRKKVQIYLVIGSLWFSSYAIGFTVLPLIFLLQVSNYAENGIVNFKQSLILFIGLLGYTCLQLVQTLLCAKYLKIYFAEIEPIQAQPQEQPKQEKMLQYLKINLPFKIIQISSTYFEFIDPNAQNKQISLQCSNQSVINQKQKLKAFEFMAKTEQLNSPVAHDENFTDEKCTICFDNPPGIVLLPCQHGGICEDCLNTHLQKSKRCPLCREKFQQFLRVNKNQEGKYSVKDIGLYL